MKLSSIALVAPLIVACNAYAAQSKSGINEGPLECWDRFRNGTYTGVLTRIIDQDKWDITNYELKLDDDRHACVRASLDSPERRVITREAFLRGLRVTVATDVDSEITGIEYQNP